MPAFQHTVFVRPHQRNLAALSQERPDRLPLFEHYWPETTKTYRAALGFPAEQRIEEYFGVEMHIVTPDETPYPSQAKIFQEQDDERVEQDGWGRTIRSRTDSYFFQTVDVTIKEKADLDRHPFESPAVDSRYEEAEASLQRKRPESACFVKTGGPFLRSCFMRGEEKFLMDMASDQSFATELVSRIAEHQIAVGLEGMKRFDLYHTGVFIYDDMASNDRPMFSPAAFNRILAPAYARMISTWKNAGARFVLLHCDGNLLPILDRLVELGIDGLNPIEPKAGMSLPDLRRKYGRRLALIGGVCNARILPSGDKEAIRHHVEELVEAGRDGGVIVGGHSIGPDISPETYVYYHSLVRELGDFSKG